MDYRTQPLSTVQRIINTRNAQVRSIDDLEKIVELSLLKACQIFYDKNIQTLSTNANIHNGFDGYLIFDYAFMSEENQGIARTLDATIRPYDGYDAVIINFPLNPETLIGEIEDFSGAIKRYGRFR